MAELEGAQEGGARSVTEAVAVGLAAELASHRAPAHRDAALEAEVLRAGVPVVEHLILEPLLVCKRRVQARGVVLVVVIDELRVRSLRRLLALQQAIGGSVTTSHRKAR